MHTVQRLAVQDIYFILTPYEKRQEIAEQLARVFTSMKVCELEIDHTGITVNKEERIEL